MEEILVKRPWGLCLQLLKNSYLLVVQMGSSPKEMWSILQIKGWLHIICTYLSVERKTTPTFPQWAFPHIPVCIFFPLRSPAQGYLHCRSAGSAGQGQFCLTTSFWPAEGSYTPSLGYECLRFSTLSRRASAFCALSLAVFIGFLFPRLPPV